MGKVTFVQTPQEIVHPWLLDRLVYWKEGEYYHQGRLDRLRRSLHKVRKVTTSAGNIRNVGGANQVVAGNTVTLDASAAAALVPASVALDDAVPADPAAADTRIVSPILGTPKSYRPK